MNYDAQKLPLGQLRRQIPDDTLKQWNRKTCQIDDLEWLRCTQGQHHAVSELPGCLSQ